MRPPNGCAGLTLTAVSKSSSALSLKHASARPPRLRDEFSGWRERRFAPRQSVVGQFPRRGRYVARFGEQ